MKERPIIFNGEMVRAILDGRKTQTRRVIKGIESWPDEPLSVDEEGFLHLGTGSHLGTISRIRCPYGVPGDRPWVRETWQNCPECGGVNWRADANEKGTICQHCDDFLGKWKRSIHMWREYSRIMLPVVRVWPERIQDISLYDIVQEGYPDLVLSEKRERIVLLQRKLRAEFPAALAWFRHLWDSINAKRGYPFDSNCWVWAIEFEAAAIS